MSLFQQVRTFLDPSRRHGSGVLLSAIACSVMLASCGDPEGGAAAGDAGTPVKGEWLIIHELSDAEGINPIVINDASGRAIADRVYEKLLDQDFTTLELTPTLVEARPTISDDHLTYTFKLREGITFSDGKPLTGKDVVFSFKAMKNPFVIDAAPNRNYYEDVKDVTSPDDRTIVVTMSRPYFLAEFHLGAMYILAKHKMDPQNLTDKYTFAETNDLALAEKSAAMKEFGHWFGKPEIKLDPAMNVGSGPYVFEEWKTHENITLRRNDKYWNKDSKVNPAYAEKLIYRVVPDRSAAVTALKNGELDFMEYVPPIKFEEEVDTNRTPHLAKRTYESQAYTYIGWNAARPALSDKRVRRALSHLVDRDALMKQILRGIAKPINSPIYPQSKEYDNSIQAIDYNPAKAKALLAEAGWGDSDNDGYLDKMIDGRRTDLAFSFLLNSGNEAREQIALIVTDECKKVGIKVSIQKLEWAVFLENLRTRKFDAYIGSWVNDPIPSDPYQLWHSSQADNKGSNYVGFRNKRADELMELNRTEFDETKRKEYMHEFQRIVVEEQPYTFLWMPLFPAVYNRRLQNVQFTFIRPGYNPTQWWVPKSSWKYAPVQ